MNVNIKVINLKRHDMFRPLLGHHQVSVIVKEFKKYKLPGSNQIPEELIQAGGETLQSEIHKLINSI
jgi:hypothetical protein